MALVFAPIIVLAVGSFILSTVLILWTIKRILPSAGRLVPCTLPFTFYTRWQHSRDALLRALHAKHGASFFVRVSKALNALAGQEFVTSDPKVVAEVFGRQQLDNFGERTDQYAPHGKGHLFNCSGERWHQLRKKVMPIFAKHNVDSMAALLHDAVDQMLENVESDTPFDFRSASIMLNASVISRIVYFTAFPDRFLDQFPREHARFGARVFLAKEQALQADGQGVPFTQALMRALQSRLLGQRLPTEPDLIGALHAHIMQAEPKQAHAQAEVQEEDGDDVRAESKLGSIVMEGSMTAAGIETVGHLLATVVRLFTEHPELQARLRAQLEHEEEPALLRAVIRETLRLYPISSFATARTCTHATQLKSCDAHFRVGDTVQVNVFAMGRDVSVWGPDAEKFRPERWLDEDTKLAPSWKSHWLPFGTGARICPGQQLALALLKIAIASMVRRYRILPVDAKTVITPLAGESTCVRFQQVVDLNNNPQI